MVISEGNAVVSCVGHDAESGSGLMFLHHLRLPERHLQQSTCDCDAKSSESS